MEPQTVCKHISSIDEVKFIRMRKREMVVLTKFLSVNSFGEALMNMICELKISSQSKKIV